jgi:hypothetical protein
MKKIIFLGAFSVGILLLQAQHSVHAVNPAITDYNVTALSNSIMGKLNQGLKLSVMQQQQVTTVVSAFLTQKENIIPLKNSTPTEYRKKQAGLYNSLRSRLTSILSKSQMNKFLGMRPAAEQPGNSISQLFY